VDVNRAGSPLMEIVSEPDLATPAEAREYLVELRKILRYIGVSDANLEEGDFRCDANISLRRPGAPELGAKVEVKNMNSFRAVYDALAFEQVRQAAVLERGDTVPQETRGWVEARHETVAQRSKEYAHDYRYFPEPDLPPLRLGRDYVARLAAVLPELPAARRARFEGALGLSQEEAAALTDSRERADYFEELAGAVAAASGAGRGEAARAAAHWVLGEVGRWSNESGLGIASFPIPAERLAGLIALAEEGKVTGATAKQVFDSMVETGKAAAEIVSEGGLAQISGSGELREAVRRALAANERAVADYRAGKESAVKFLIGQVMRETRGRANPQVLQDLFKEELA
jgi:aspartyl-tRNA(Asn)/glutamyl-tRNA(Gln) amidotransferase subunit B